MLIKKLFAILFVSAALGYQCKSSDTTEKDHTESAVPPELKDSTAIQTDDSKALEQLKNVVGDSTQKK